MAIIISNEDLRTTLGNSLDAIAGKLPADKDFVLVPKEDHIPKYRFDEVNISVKDYKAQIAERDKQIADLMPKAKGHDELTKTLQELRDLNTKTVNDYELKISEQSKNSALKETLSVYKPRNVKAVVALLDATKIEYKDGTLKGAQEQLEALRKSDPYLFDLGDTLPPGAAGRGHEQQPGGTGDPAMDAFKRAVLGAEKKK